MSDICFDRNFDPAYGTAVPLGPDIRRLTARNSGPFTFHGTNTYIIGHGSVAILDPGPDRPEHIDALLRATAGESVSHILVTHTHRDHSAGAARLKALTGAPTLGAGPHRFARLAQPGEMTILDAGGDTTFVPDRDLVDGERIAGRDWALRTIATPGHAANHLSFALENSEMLFSGDHVMGWSTTVVAPPDGSMADYIASLDVLAARPETIYLPGHGAPIADAANYTRALKTHRRLREASIVERIQRGDHTIPEIVAVLYRETPMALHGAAALSVLAHIEDLISQGRVRVVDGFGITAVYETVSGP